eukprot:1138547-Pelagomonas_calceolata.AAC.4
MRRLQEAGTFKRLAWFLSGSSKVSTRPKNCSVSHPIQICSIQSCPQPIYSVEHVLGQSASSLGK